MLLTYLPTDLASCCPGSIQNFPGNITVQNGPYSLLYASIKTLILECFMIAYTNSPDKHVIGMLYDSLYHYNVI